MHARGCRVGFLGFYGEWSSRDHVSLQYHKVYRHPNIPALPVSEKAHCKPLPLPLSGSCTSSIHNPLYSPSPFLSLPLTYPVRSSSDPLLPLSLVKYKTRKSIHATSPPPAPHAGFPLLLHAWLEGSAQDKSVAVCFDSNPGSRNDDGVSGGKR